VIGLIQLALFAGLLSLASSGGVLIGLLPPAFILGGKGIANLFTRSR
jgi:hypothetical protein